MYTRQIKKNKADSFTKNVQFNLQLFITHCVLKNLPYILDKNNFTKYFKKVSNLI